MLIYDTSMYPYGKYLSCCHSKNENKKDLDHPQKVKGPQLALPFMGPGNEQLFCSN